MRVNRENVLGILESVSPGLASRELIEQGSCLVFHKGRVCTFNDEVFCFNKSPFGDIEGAIPAKSLMDLLRKLKEDEIEIEAAEGELIIKGKGKRSGLRMEATVLLPIEAVETPEEWSPLETEFCDAVGIVRSCASGNESTFVLTCVHIHPEYMEACDRFQIVHYPISTPVKAPVLVRASSIQGVAQCGMSEISETPSWLHFRNPSGLNFCCRKFMEEYPKVGQFLEKDGGVSVVLPGGLEEILSRTEVFSGENSTGNSVTVSLKSEMIGIRGEGPSGWYEERQKIPYDGPALKFMVAPKLLVALSKKSNECLVSKDRLMIETGKFTYVTCTDIPKESESK